ncbi:transporter substrate-binding domain-containing protein [Geovibrio thiophilus]|uniref:Transporter substrate-binding domain-containing protein n=1 Tax=Geovibrio thiophilus TaxID=139438 RepID=A0A410JY75_9BACT|nr:ABC transporter substrate-binding protein [Geovibrio thiophilus]QAR33008.1 transporter substrate-binding domain-containing protein [Geovibrio thiophilus]
MKKLTAFIVTGLLLLTAAASFAEGLDDVKKKGELTFSLTGQYPPFNFVDDKNTVTGFDVEIGKAVAERIGVTGKPVTTAWDGIIAGLIASKYDLICGSMAITEQRLKSIDFSDPYYRSGAQIFAGNSSDIGSSADLDGKKIGVTLGTTYEQWVRENIKGAEIKTYKGVPDMILETATGRIDAFVTDKIVGAMAIRDKNAPLKLVGGLLYEERMGIAMLKGNPKLKNAVNKALADMKNDGTYEKISMKWLGIDAR